MRPTRGFSFRLDGPLDMRMGGEGPSAADVVAHASERDLAAIIATLGEERHARAVARAIVRARAEAPIATTRALAEIVDGVVHARPGAIHPATRTFQALRMFVNEELAELARGAGRGRNDAAARRPARRRGLPFARRPHRQDVPHRARPARGGSRHLPEARGPAPTFRLLTGRPVTPDDAEIAANPRARSAKLRAAERTDAPVRAERCGRAPATAAVARGRHGEVATMIRLLNICVIAALVVAAAHVYKIKFESTRQAERVAKLRMEIRGEHDAIATLRAEWSKLDNPARIQELAQRHLKLKPIEPRQFDRSTIWPAAARPGAAGDATIRSGF